MKKNFPIIIVEILLVLFISGCAQKLSEDNSGDFTSFKNDFYTIDYPSSWEVEEHEAFVYFRPLLVGDDAETQGNVVIYVAPAESETQTITEFFQASVRVLVETAYPEFTFIEYKEEKLSSTPAYRIVYAKGKGSEIIQYLQVFTLKKGNTYVITYAAPPETYKKDVSNIEKIIRSFRIK